jgi:hypothetical protein
VVEQAVLEVAEVNGVEVEIVNIEEAAQEP